MFYAIFDEYEFKPSLNDIYVYIKELIKNYNQNEFDLDEYEIKALIHYAKKSRLEFSINKNIPRFKARRSFHSLIDKKMIFLEKNIDFMPKIKRFYPQNKIIFNSNFTRFYFYYLKPNEKLLFKNPNALLEYIKNDLHNYLSFTFEQIAREFCNLKFNIQVQSIWGKNYELDLFCQDEEFCMVGEVKFLGKPMCLSDYSRLVQKAKDLNLDVNKFILFSNSGFSKKLLEYKDDNLIRANLNSFLEFV